MPQVVTIHHKTFMGIKVSGDPKRWTYHVDRNMLRLTAAEEPNRWILLERAE